jgi:methylglutaconyl-CoA hydratase
MRSDTVQVRYHDVAGTIILNRPDRHNALNATMISQVERAFERFHRESRIRAVILTGAGAAFCAGADLYELHDTAGQQDAEWRWGHEASAYQDLIVTMLEFPKPIIAAVSGLVTGSGAGLLLASDLVIGGEDTQFGFPEPRRGMVAGVVSPLLAFRIGGGQAARLLMTSALIDSAEAERLGVIHERVSADKVWARAMQWAVECAQGAPEALALTKRLLHETIGGHLAAQIACGAAMSATSQTTDVATEGLAAFMEKRPPYWQPKDERH